MAKNIPTIEECENVANTLKILAHPQRLMILCQLAEGEKTVSDLEELTTASQSQISQFLARMKSENLVDSNRDGSFVYYSVKDQDIFKLLQSMQKIYCAPK